jgi:uracil-DNA glycosylase family 4
MLVAETGILFYCVISKPWLQFALMEKDTDINKIVQQHAEMDNFFTGGFAVKSNKAEQKHTEAGKAAIAEAVKELEKIADETRQCRKCPLGSLRTNAVPGEGNPKARIVFVGEGPGADEDAQGRPFVGRAGQLLDKVIEACGLKRSDVFICNILKCRPPGNRDPRAEEIINCFPYLQRQIEIIEPEIIVALGAPAARTLLNTNKSIGQLRGQFHEYYAGLGRPPIKLMPTYHTAYLLRNYSQDNRRRVWEDMKKVLTELGLPIPEHRKE